MLKMKKKWRKFLKISHALPENLLANASGVVDFYIPGMVYPQFWYFSYFSKKNVVGSHQKRLTEGLLMSTHNIGFLLKNKIYLRDSPSCLLL